MTKREKVYAKYDGRCSYCGRKIAYKDMQVDHKIPQMTEEACYGGNDPKELNDISNLMPSCRTCNHYKRAKSIEQFRRDIETIPKKLGERQYIYKIGMAYGFYDSTPRKVEFYFEKQEKESVDRG